MSVVVTGATGYIGRRLALRLVAEGRPLKVLCRDPQRLDPELANSPLVEVIRGDVSDERVFRRACVAATSIIHLAAAMSGTAEEFDRSTIGGTAALLSAATAERVPRLVYVSSMSVYDYTSLSRGAVVDEETPLEARPELRDHYARSKRIAEAMVAEQMAKDGPSITIVRPGIVYGPGGRDPLTPVTSLRSVRGRFFMHVGGGRREVPLVHVENLVDALLLMLDSEAASGRTYNAIDTDPPTEREYLAMLQRVTRTTMRIARVPTWVIVPLAAAAEQRRRLRGRVGMDVVHGLRRVTGEIRFDAGKLQRQLGWAPGVSLETGMLTSFGGLPSDGPEPARRPLPQAVP